MIERTFDTLITVPNTRHDPAPPSQVHLDHIVHGISRDSPAPALEPFRTTQLDQRRDDVVSGVPCEDGVVGKRHTRRTPLAPRREVTRADLATTVRAWPPMRGARRATTAWAGRCPIDRKIHMIDVAGTHMRVARHPPWNITDRMQM
jgi:hypothetical protein